MQHHIAGTSPDPNVALALLGRALPDKRLRIGLLCSTRHIERWAFEAVATMLGAPGFDVCGGVIWNHPPETEALTLSARAFAAYHSRCPVPTLLQPADLTRLVAVQTFDGVKARANLESMNLDVVISLDGKLPRERSEGLARYGVWSVVWGDPLQPLRAPAFFWELHDDAVVTCAALVAHTERFDTARLLHRIACATAPSVYYTKNAEETPAAMKRIVIRRLYDLLIDGWEHVTSDRIECPASVAAVVPDPLRLGAFLAKRTAVSAIMRRRGRRGQGRWFVSYRTDSKKFTHLRDRFTPEDFEELPPPGPRHACADPFVVSTDGSDAIFVEDILPDGRGRLAVYSRERSGSWQPSPAVIFDRPEHLSYPCVFENEGEHYLIPESSAARRVELWRAVKFPHQWTLETVYAEGVGLVDTTPVQVDGRWYFFTTAVGPDASAMELFIFHSETLRGPWQAHPMNPVCADVRAARMAGHFFRRNDRLIRPAQDCSGVYGRAIRLHEVLRLTPTEYAEREVERIEPSWHAQSERTHTINATGSIEVIDGWRRYRR
jgi:hypothetical protein